MGKLILRIAPNVDPMVQSLFEIPLSYRLVIVSRQQPEEFKFPFHCKQVLP